MTIGERIREIRRDQNISQTQLAQAVGLNQPQVSAIEGGRVKPSAKTIERIATALLVPVENITNEQPKPDPTFTPYQVMLIYKAIQHRIDEEINHLADGMQVDKSEVLRVWEEHKDDYDDNRHHSCPLVEVPTPHGDLVDRDDLIDEINRVTFVKRYDYNVAYNIVTDAETIIEAEVSEG